MRSGNIARSKFQKAFVFSHSKEKMLFKGIFFLPVLVQPLRLYVFAATTSNGGCLLGVELVVSNKTSRS